MAEPTTTTTAAPAAATTVPDAAAAPAAKALDPFVAALAKSMNIAVADTPPVKPIEVDPGLPMAPTTLGERAPVEPKKEEAKPGAGEAVAPAAPGTPPPAAAAPAEKPKVKVEKPMAAALQSELDRLKALPTQPPAVQAPAAAVTPTSDDEYIKTLTPEQKEELSFAEFAEKNGNDGQRKKVLEYFKATDAFAKANPEATADSDEFKEFLEKHQPRYTNRQQLEKKQIVEQTRAEVTADVARQQVDTNRKLRALELKPTLDKAVENFSALLVSPEALPEGVTAIDPEVAEVINKQGFAAAQKQFPVEAPIYDFTTKAAGSYLRIINGVETFDPDKNQVHRWVGDFVGGQERALMAGPESARRVNGRIFLPADQYAGVLRTKPAEADRYWTFNDTDVLSMMRTNAHSEASSRLKELEAAGFKRERKPKETNVAPPASKHETAQAARPAAGATTTQESPKASSGAMPGAKITTPATNENASFLERLMPGGGKFAA